MELWKMSFLGNEFKTWLIGLEVMAGSYVALHVLKRQLVRHVGKLAAQTNTQLDDLVVDLIEHTRQFFLLSVSLYFGLTVLKLTEKADHFLDKALVLVILMQVAVWGLRLIDFAVEQHAKSRGVKDAASVTTIGMINLFARVVLYGMLVLLALRNLGVDITALVAGLGVGGIAIALAVQNILGDLFASLTIVLDRPFVVGDFIVVGDFSGAIEKIGLKTTRIRSLSGEQLIFSNTDLLKSRIRNFKQMRERRVAFSLSLEYDTPIEKLRKVPAIVKSIVESRQSVRFERCQLSNCGAYSLNFDVVYWMTTADYDIYMENQQIVNLDILEAFRRENIKFAYPTQTLRLGGGAPVNPIAPVQQPISEVSLG